MPGLHARGLFSLWLVNGKEETEGRSMPHFGLDLNHSAMSLHDPRDRCQTQSSAILRRLGGVEGLKDTLQFVRLNASP